MEKDTREEAREEERKEVHADSSGQPVSSRAPGPSRGFSTGQLSGLHRCPRSAAGTREEKSFRRFKNGLSKKRDALRGNFPRR
ncbi:hypothetical protein EYF80_026021 [Liparis tanakae]|uniref:Uncharacterized protein n=1 Tax=Liparis tanakae TaxID=230148 RepID=A0A4Z2HDA4_9TELE|nr:hypothetical protein EYF80_026021 [Liparis tanakae]